MMRIHRLTFISIIQVLSLHEAYDFSCPVQAHWKLRAISKCASQINYSCLFDVNLQVNVYRDKCIRPRIVGPGYKYVFQPNPNRDSCGFSRYQPFIFNTTGYSDCVFLKSHCNSDGQTTHKNGTTRSDKTCTCEARKGYMFVNDPLNKRYCNPTSEDCSCYIGINPNNITDFECSNEINMRNLSRDLLNTAHSFESMQFSNYKYNLAGLPTSKYRTSAAVHVLILSLSYLLVVLGLYILQRYILNRCQLNKRNYNNKYMTSSNEIKQKTALPEVINRLQESDIIRYKELMESSTTAQRYIVRIMIVGKESVGKTSLLRRLLKDSTAGVCSTDGVDIVVNRCRINIEDGKWTIGKDIPDDKLQIIQRAMVNGSMRGDTVETTIMNNDACNLKYKEEIKCKESVEIRGDNTYEYEQASCSPDLPTYTLMDEKSNSTVKEEPPIRLFSSMTAFTNDSKEDIETLNDIHKMNDDSGDQLRENQYESLTNLKGTLKENEDEQKSASLLMPLDLLSRVFSTTPTANVPIHVDALCGLWDFAGQREFYATHQAFLTSGAIYLVVADMADDIFKQKVEKHSTDFEHAGDYFDFWFDTIHCHQTVYPTKDKQQDNLVDPPVIVVFTGKDKLKKENLEKTEEEIKIRLGELLRSQTKYQHLRNIFFISNTTDPDEPFEELRQEISAAATKMPNWGELMPLKWILLEHLIEINKENGKKITSLFEMIKMAEHPDINVHEIKDVLLFLRFQHVIGNIIYFEDIPDLIILNPQWLVDAFRCLASNKYDAKPQQLQDWIQFVQYGQLSDILITELFKSKCGEHFLEQRDNVLKVMEKFDILVKKKDSGFYIMPSKMPFSSFDEVCDKIGVRHQNCKRTSWLCLKFEFLPPAFYNHLAVWFIKHYNPTKMQNEGQLVAFFRGICIFDINSSGCEKLLVAMSTDTIALQILSFSAEDKEFGSPCSTIYKDLFSKVEAIIERYDLTITFDVCFKCNKGDFHKDATPYKDLLKNSEFYCLQHQQAHKSEELYLPWMKNAYENLRESNDKNQDQIHKPKKMLKTYAKRLKDGEATEIAAEMDKDDTKSSEDNVAHVKHRERNYMGMLEYREKDEQALIKNLIMGSKDLKDNSTDECIPPRLLTTKTSSDEQIKCLKVIFESVEDMLGSPDYYTDLREELSNACPNYMNVLLTAKRDLLRNDCGIVVTGETSAGKTTLINLLIGQKVLKTGNLATTGTITRIRDSETMKIQCFSKDETLKKEKEVPDVKKMKSIIAKLTDIKLPSYNVSDIYFVDVYLPVPILKGNVIVVDTPGIGENENLDNILLDFLPHAVSFVFVVNAKETGGIHENKLSKILKTIMDNREKMPFFDPREVMILTNQRDAIENDDTDSDEDDDSDIKKEDQHTETFNLIKKKFETAWCSLDEENVYRVSLTQVGKGIENFFTAEYKRFQTVLKKTIEKNENKRINFYYRFLKDFIQNAERGTLARLNILERSEEEQRQIILQNRTKIQNLQSQCKQSKETLEKYKTDIIKSLTKKLHNYLTSHDGKEEILNPHGSKPISKISYISLQQEVQSRFNNGLQRWGTGQEAALIMKPADDYLRSQIKDVESKLHEIEISMTGKEEAGDFTKTDGDIIVLAILTLPITLVLSVAICVVFLPISVPFLLEGHYAGFDYRQHLIDETYNTCLFSVSMASLKEKFEASFGDEYDKVIVHIFDNHFSNLIRSMIMTNESLLEKHKIIKQNQDLFAKLGEKIRLIQKATESFEMIMDCD